jgi:anti-sigma regulatory factor (Ser/Thr protein kinase)
MTGPPPFAVRLSPDPASVPVLLDALEAWLAGIGLPDETRLDVVLALDEAVANVIEHGYRGAPGEIEVDAALTAGEVELRVVDGAPPFDPLDATPPELTGDLDHRRIGGLGIHLIRTLMDAVEYRREEGRNVLLMRVCLPEQS